MAYWGSGAGESDFAATTVGAYIYLLKERMHNDIRVGLDQAYPEQSIVATIICLRLIGERFPQNLSVHFRRKDFEAAQNAFEDWYKTVQHKLPSKFRTRIYEEAHLEFKLFEERLLSKASHKASDEDSV